jgi:hypothetical protein
MKKSKWTEAQIVGMLREQSQEQRDAFTAAIEQRVDRVFRIK